MKKAAFFLPLILILFYWKNILLGLSNKLIGWNDEPFVIWVLQNNIVHFRALDFTHLYDTNALYGFSNSLSFAEHLFFPSLIATSLSFFISSPIAQLNILFVLNHVLIYICVYLLLGRFVENKWARIIGAFYFSFTPYFFSQLGHFQMIFFWPLLLSIYYLTAPKSTLKSLVLTGIWIGLQFLSSVYLGIMNLFIITLYLFVQVLFKKNVIVVLKEYGTIIGIFLLVSLVSIIGYVRMNSQYHPQRDYGEYVTYAANTTDYFFSAPRQTSILQQLVLGKITSKYNRHTIGEKAAFIGILPLLCMLFYFFALVRNKKVVELKISFTEAKLFLFLLIICGFVFSLGPRLNVNGYYTTIPLPYHILLKLFPPIGIMRAVARWYFLISFASGIIFTICLQSLLSMHHIKKWRVGVLTLFILVCFEFYPFPIGASAKTWKTPTTDFLTSQCTRSPGPLLEYPFQLENVMQHIVENLQYRTGILLASTQFSCPIISGFSGYEPKELLSFENELINGNDAAKIDNLLATKNIRYVMINKKMINEKQDAFFSHMLSSSLYKNIYEDDEEILFMSR